MSTNAFHILTTGACLLFAAEARTIAQGFVNLDFESATVTDLSPGVHEFVPATAGLPGWTVFYGLNQQTVMTHNSETLGAANVGILGPSMQMQPAGDIIDGKYTVILQPGQQGVIRVASSIAQIGQVPFSAKSLYFTAAWDPLVGEDFSVTLGGQELTLHLVNQVGQSTVYGADITPYAGQMAELRFSALPIRSSFSGFTLDSISFSTADVPEPGTLSLFGVGLLGLGCWCRRNFSARKSGPFNS